MYCSERCRLEDLHSEAAYGAGFFYVGDHDGQSWGGEGSSFTATTSTSSSAMGCAASRSKSPRMRSGRRGSAIAFDSPNEVPMSDGSEYFDADKANADYFESLRSGRRYFTTTTTVPPSRAMSGDIYAVPEDYNNVSSISRQQGRSSSRASHSRSSINTLSLHAIAPLSRTNTQSSIQPPPPSPTLVASSSVPHNYVHALYGGAYPLAFERSKSSGAVGRTWREMQKKEAMAAERERARREESSEATTVSEGSSNGKRHERQNRKAGNGGHKHRKSAKGRFDDLEPEFEGPLLTDDERQQEESRSPISHAPPPLPTSPNQISSSLPATSHLNSSHSHSRSRCISITSANKSVYSPSTSKRSSFAYGTPSLLLQVSLPFASPNATSPSSLSPSRHGHSRQFSTPINDIGKGTAKAVLSTINAVSSSVPHVSSYFPPTSQHYNPSRTSEPSSRVSSNDFTMNINVMGPMTIPGGAIAHLKKTSTESYVPTYLMDPIPVKPGEKRKRLFHFGGA